MTLKEKLLVLKQAQYSIYKINSEAVKKIMQVTGKDELDVANNTITALINNIEAIIEKKQVFSTTVNFQGFRGIVFKTIHTPAWANVADTFIRNTQDKCEIDIPENFISNTNISYVYFYLCENKIFAITGGYGSNYISRFIEKNFGLYILPKIFKKDHPVVKNIIQNNLIGNQTSLQKTNKNTTTIQNEQDMNSIFRQISTAIPRHIAERLGIVFEEKESQNKTINIINKDSIVIHRAITLEELKRIIKNIYWLEQQKDNFALNYLISAQKKGFKNSKLYDCLLQTLIEEKYGNFLLTGGDYTVFLTSASSYFIKDNKTKEVIIEQNEPISFLDIIKLLDNKTKSSMKNMLKNWFIEARDNNGNLLLNIPIFQSIQGFVEFGEKKEPIYLFNGEWYIFDGKFTDILREEFRNIFQQQSELRKVYCKEFSLIKNVSNEEEYNSQTKQECRFIVAHKTLVHNIELADVIIIKENNVFLMHNKDSFDGVGVRDVTNQVLTSAAFLQKMIYSAQRDDFFEDYYNKLESKYNNDNLHLPITKEKFKNCFYSGKIHYLIGYISKYSQNSKSLYAQYLTVDTIKKLASKGIDCVPILIGSEEV